MKNLVTLTFLFFGMLTYAQSKNAKATIKVDGVCMMCKERIEKAAIRTKGVKAANWNVKTHDLKLIYDARKTDLKTIQEKVIAVGHDTQDMKALDEVYNNIHPCCKYRDEAVRADHVDGKKKN